jgi:hypothetical protein
MKLWVLHVLAWHCLLRCGLLHRCSCEGAQQWLTSWRMRSVRILGRLAGMGVWIGFDQLGTGTGVGLLWVRWWTFGFLRHGVSKLHQCQIDSVHFRNLRKIVILEFECSGVAKVGLEQRQPCSASLECSITWLNVLGELLIELSFKWLIFVRNKISSLAEPSPNSPIFLQCTTQFWV